VRFFCCASPKRYGARTICWRVVSQSSSSSPRKCAHLAEHTICCALASHTPTSGWQRRCSNMVPALLSDKKGNSATDRWCTENVKNLLKSQAKHGILAAQKIVLIKESSPTIPYSRFLQLDHRHLYQTTSISQDFQQRQNVQISNVSKDKTCRT
jgi:hypothetical protein